MLAIAGFFLFVLGSVIGLKLADCDQYLRWYPLLQHRSLLTHGLLIPLLLFFALGWPARKQRSGLPACLFVMGFCLSSAVHLAFDLFPSQWVNRARIHVPFVGWESPAFSQVWIVIGLMGCLVLTCLLLRNMREVVLCVLGMIVAFGVSVSRAPDSGAKPHVGLLNSHMIETRLVRLIVALTVFNFAGDASCLILPARIA